MLNKSIYPFIFLSFLQPPYPNCETYLYKWSMQCSWEGYWALFCPPHAYPTSTSIPMVQLQYSMVNLFKHQTNIKFRYISFGAINSGVFLEWGLEASSHSTVLLEAPVVISTTHRHHHLTSLAHSTNPGIPRVCGFIHDHTTPPNSSILTF